MTEPTPEQIRIAAHDAMPRRFHEKGCELCRQANERVQQDRRRTNLRFVMEKYRIEHGPDYQHEELYEILGVTHDGKKLERPLCCGRYAAVTHDETYSFANVWEDLGDACNDLASSLGQESGGQITGIWDLDNNTFISVDVKVTVTPNGRH